ncbi:MAG: PD-(D/E)XK nuclease family transposase, partial [Ruminococcus sp.]|nr:PD-(D/E)XK nuclease family transposase [Ruminococcus sp.]
MNNGLKEYFPVIREREEVLDEIYQKPSLKALFETWTEKQQEEFLDYCTGVKGIKLLYDSFFKEIINPDVTPERLEEILSFILQMKVKILKVLPSDSARIAAETSLLVLDVVVELEDGSIANVEVQKIGYNFPGQRSACYSADLLLRQYKRVKGEKGKKFSYRDIKKVYTIIFFEKSQKEFRSFKKNYTYLHRSSQKSNTGLKIDLLQEYIFINLDIFRLKLDNNGVTIENKFEAWLTFLSVDEPEVILKLLNDYPEFKRLYDEVYDMCRNMERFMGIFSEELRELDKNTVELMIDEMQEELDERKKELGEAQERLDTTNKELDATNKELDATNKELDATNKELDATNKELDATNKE